MATFVLPYYKIPERSINKSKCWLQTRSSNFNHVYFRDWSMV